MARNDRALAAVLALAAALLYNANPWTLPTHDADSNVYLAATFLEEGRLSFAPSRSPWLFDPQTYAVTPSARLDPVTHEQLYVSTYGAGPGLAALPVFAAVRAWIGEDLRTRPGALWFAARLAASLLAAASVAFVYLVARHWCERRYALLVAMAYAVGTSVWSATSQTLWQHPTSTFFLTLGTYFLVRAREEVPAAAAAGAAFSAAVACRPTSLAFAVAAAVFLLSNRRAFAAYLGASLPIAIGVAAFNTYFLGSPFKVGQVAAIGAIADDAWRTSFWEGLGGILVSPSRGLFVFSPFLVIGVAGATVAWRRDEYAPLRPLTIAVPIVLMAHAKWAAWWGGYSYGYRIIVDLAPVLAVLMVPAIRAVLATRPRRFVFAASLAWSVLLQALGVASEGGDWNSRKVLRAETPAGSVVMLSQDELQPLADRYGMAVARYVSLDIDKPENHDRLWSLRDNQIAYELANLSRTMRENAGRRTYAPWW